MNGKHFTFLVFLIFNFFESISQCKEANDELTEIVENQGFYSSYASLMHSEYS